MKLLHVLFVALLFWNAGCSNPPKPSEKTTPDASAPESVAGISLICQDLGMDKLEIPHTVLMLGENGGATLIDTVSVSLSKIEKERYAEMGIPSDAIDACGGWFAGGGDYFYVVKVNGSAVVYKGFQEEEQTDKGYHWMPVQAK